jgi:hypothetical protein
MTKKQLTLLLGLILSSNIYAQNGGTNEKTIVTYPTSFGVSKPLSELFEKQESTSSDELKESEDKKHRKAKKYIFSAKDGIAYKNDENSIQRVDGNRALAAPIANWAGQAGGGCPADPSGAIGLKHYIQAVNASPFKIFDKATGATVGTIKNIGSLWSPATEDLGDPIVLYDKYADRWLISQFGDPKQIYIAISKTNDPTGAYYTYNFTMPKFSDYFKLSVWQDGYYMTSNGTSFVNVFERNAMITGNANARVLTKTITAPPAGGFWCPLPADADGTLPPANTPCPFLYYTDNGWGSNISDAIQIQNMTTVWAGTPSLTVSSPITIPVAAFDSEYNPDWNDVEQGVGTQKIDAIGGALMYRSQWRKWAGYNTLLACWSVKLAPGRYNTKWVELRQNQTTNVWSLHQEGVYAPDNLSRWLASISMDDNGNIGMSYLTAGKSPIATAPSLRYTGRLKNDPLGKMTFAEQTAAAGAGASNCGVRVGDYSQTTLDPSDGVTFWHTGMYFNGGKKTRVYSYKLSPTLGVAEFNSQAAFNIYQSGDQLNISASKIESDKDFMIDLFDMNGKQISGKTINNNTVFETSIDVSGLTKGVYLVRIGNLDFQKVVKTVIQ